MPPPNLIVGYYCGLLLLAFLVNSSLSKKLEIWPYGGDNALNFTQRQPTKGSIGEIGDINYGDKRLVCYYGSWATYRRGAGRVSVDMLDPFVCTHIIYSFFGLDQNYKLVSLDPWNDFDAGLGSLRRLTRLRARNPRLKTLISVGGWNEGSANYSRMAGSFNNRARFITSVVEFLKRHQLDGMDLDWEYPNYRGGRREDKRNYVELLRELSQAFRPRGYLLTAAVAAGKEMIDGGYDVFQVSKYLDLINLMAYDYHGAWDGRTGLNAPLYSNKASLSVAWSVDYWLQLGASPEKLMLGLGFYGRSFTLNKAAYQYAIGAPARKSGRPGPYTRSKGTLSYHELCLAIQRQGWQKLVVTSAERTCFAHDQRDQWASFDDAESLALKVAYAKRRRLGGVMIWSIDQDDFAGSCGTKLPLMRAVVGELLIK